MKKKNSPESEPSPSTSTKPSHLIHRPSPLNGSTGVTSNGIIPELKSRVRNKTTASGNMNSDDDGRGSSCSDRVADNEVSETLKSSESGDRIPRSKGILVPTKWQVLYFVAHTKALIIKRTGCELQVTDAASFPLFDIFQKSHCFRSTWILESYSRQVLVISDVSKTFASRRNEPQRFTVINAENETMGFFVTGDPFIIQNSERATVAHYNSFNAPESRLRSWHCVIDGTGQEICMLEHRKRDTYVVKFSGQLGFSLKLMVLAAAVQIAATPNMQTKSCCTLM
uniref:Uncharacterized protein n=1 Tax=Panagrolaimus sp. ES5 TaxID=591445 RepID=A0AC34F0K5_9BILA